jgi:hypothetical protein
MENDVQFVAAIETRRVIVLRTDEHCEFLSALNICKHFVD